MIKFHVLLLVRDEEDIIVQSLNHFSEWADLIHVFDTGSVDGTWKTVQRMAQQKDSIRLIGREPVYYVQSKVRSYMFNDAQKYMNDGDWLLRADADERYHIPPPKFVEHYMKPYEKTAVRQYYDFRLTNREVKWWKDGKEDIDDRDRPIEERRQFYTIKRSSEPRLCQYRSTMRWPTYASFPCNSGIVAEEPLPIRHYPHRDPLQMAKRYALRSIQVRTDESKTKKSLAHHWATQDWKQDVVDYNRDDLRHWEPGDSLPKVSQNDIISTGYARMLKRALYALPLSVLDHSRKAYDSLRHGADSENYLDRLPEGVEEKIKNTYKKIESGKFIQ